MAVTDPAERKRTAILALTRRGGRLAAKLAERLDADLLLTRRAGGAGESLVEDVIATLQQLFLAGRPIIALAASGIVIRALAPVLLAKRLEPPVVVMTEDGAEVIPLLGGHRGANALAREAAAITGGHAAISTAGERALGIALDAPPAGWVLENPEDAGAAMAALLDGAGLEIAGDPAGAAAWLAPLDGRAGSGDAADGRPVVRLHFGPGAPSPGDAPTQGRILLKYRPQRFVLGLGCARDCPPDELRRLAESVLAEAGVVPAALHSIATIDIKADEAAINELARDWRCPVQFFTADELEKETPRSTSPSRIVRAEVGTHGVAENAALAAVGAAGRLAVAKRKSAMATAALAEGPAPIGVFRGRPRGRLAVVGIGPGAAAWRTPEASRLVAEADELVGYGLYLDLLGPLARGRKRVEFPLGDEEARCRHALEAAGAGRRVALVSSGDAGIYAMGALVCELLDRPADQGGVSDAARRVEIVFAPGITAMQAASARVGTLLGHDFCAISLSDLLTPRETILARIAAAAQGDFVIGFYNPVSRRRQDLLVKARDMLLQHRPADTPVVLARNLGRADEGVEIVRLADLAPARVDMLTVVLVGASTSRRFRQGGVDRAYTPRGYARKLDAENGP